MSEQETAAGKFPPGWEIDPDYDPREHMMQLKGRDYLNVQNRLLWFLKDQRAFIAAGMATMPYVVRSDLVEMDREAGFAHFKTYVRDVLGNEATMYGSESAKDFADFAEKASTKSLGRALLSLGYGTANAQDMDEGGHVVDSPRERRPSRAPTPIRAPKATPEQFETIKRGCAALGREVPPPAEIATLEQARAYIVKLTDDYNLAHPKMQPKVAAPN